MRDDRWRATDVLAYFDRPRGSQRLWSGLGPHWGRRAIQNMNVMFGLAEDTGLISYGLF